VSRDESAVAPTDHSHAGKAGSCYSGINVPHRWSSQPGKGAEFGRAQQVWAVLLWIASGPAPAAWRQSLLAAEAARGCPPSPAERQSWGATRWHEEGLR